MCLGQDDLAIGIQRPKRVPEKVGRVVGALHITEPVPVLPKACHDAAGQFVSP